MENCFDLKLKGTVTDNDLPVLGIEKVRVVANTNFYKGNHGGIQAHLKATAYGCNFYSGTTNLGTTVDRADDWLALNDVADPTIAYVQYDLSTCNLIYGVMNLDDKVQYSDKVQVLILPSALASGVFYTTTGDSTIIKKRYPNLQWLQLLSSNLEGDITNMMDGLISLAYADLFNTPNITGSLESLAESQIAFGRVSGTLQIRCNEHITYQGSTIGSQVIKNIVFSNGSYSVQDP